MIRFFGLDGSELDVLEWAATPFEERIVGNTHLPNGDEEVRVSTIWLGLDHALGDPPMIFETMVFGGPTDMEQHRYATLEEARVGHAGVVEMVSLFLLAQEREL